MSRRPTLESQLTHMKSILRTMCDRVDSGMNGILIHLEQPNREQLIKIVVLDSEVDNLETALDNAILQIFATQQPMAYELRLAYACAKIAHHIERIGDAVESLARQLAGRQNISHTDVIQKMLIDTRDLFKRSYAAMFEGDLNLIHDIHALDDKVDLWQREIYNSAREILCRKPTKLEVENALQLINISAKLEKIADLSCNWAEQIDFAENGTARLKLGKRRQRIVFMDSGSGIAASLVACFLHQSASHIVDISVASRMPAAHSQAPLAMVKWLSEFNIAPQVFPLARLSSLSWSRCVLFILVGDFELSEDENEFIPFKTVKLKWPDLKLSEVVEQMAEEKQFKFEFDELQLQGVRDFLKKTGDRCQQLTELLARTQL